MNYIINIDKCAYEGLIDFKNENLLEKYSARLQCDIY